jgi:murein DD-endopeptidase MepM/ murein hydrolase activator NlpD
MYFLNDRKRLIIFLALLIVAVAGVVLIVLRREPSPAAVRVRAEDLLVISSGTISDSLDDTLKERGLPDADRYRISKAFSKVLNLRRLRSEDEYTIAFSTAAELKYLLIARDLKQYYVFPSTGPAAYRVETRDLAVSSAVVRITGSIESSLWESMSAKSVPPDLILDYADVFSWSVDFLTEVRKGDKYDLVYEYGRAANGKIVSKKILAAVYEGKELGRKLAGLWGKSYYDEAGEAVRGLFLRAPLHYRRISSYFTYHRFHPVLKYVRPHLGIDYAAPSGTPVSAVAEGTVTYAGRKGGFGNYVEIQHISGYITGYGHLSRFARGVRPGRRVGQGDVIAYVGSTGIATGPHLDFRVRQHGGFINFLKIKYRSSGGLSGKEKTAYLYGLKALLPEYFN